MFVCDVYKLKCTTVLIPCQQLAQSVIVFDPDFRQGDLGVIEQVETSPQELSIGWERFSHARRSTIKAAFGGAILRYGEEAAVEAMAAERFGLIVAAPPPRTPLAAVQTGSPSVFCPSPAWGVALARNQKADCSVGIIARDIHGREGVTTALHAIQSLGARTTKIFVNGVEGTLDPKDTNTVTDSCFIEVAGVASSPTTPPLKGPLTGVTPRTNEQMTFERLSLQGPERVRTHVIGWSSDLPWVTEPWNQVKVMTEPSSIPGDSGAALIDKDGYVIGFAFYVTTSGPGGYGYSAWIWQSRFSRRTTLYIELRRPQYIFGASSRSYYYKTTQEADPRHIEMFTV